MIGEHLVELFIAGHSDECPRGYSETDCSGTENKPSIAVSPCCGLLPLIL
jgi:hypothetical protein